jgi:hypothetical protein
MSNFESDNGDNYSTSINKSDKIVVLEFTSGYEFRHIFEHAKMITNELPIYCSKNFVTTNRANDKQNIIVTNIINTENLTKYYFNDEYATQKSDGNNFHVINMNFGEAFKYIKSIGKTGSVRIYKNISEPDITYIQYFGGGKTEDEIIPIPDVKYELNAYNVNETNPRESNNPNAVISLKNFISKITDIQKMKYTNVVLRCFPKGVHIYAYNDLKNIRTISWGEDYHKKFDNKPENTYDITIIEQFMKTIIKTSSFHTDGIVRIYCNQDNLVRLETPIGCFGTNITYLTVPQI